MVRINLLPQEIIERRRYERFFPYVFIAGAIMIGITVIAWVALQFFVSERAATLQQTKESTQQLTAQATALEVFDKRETEVAARQKAAEDALRGRVNIGRIAEEFSLVLPDEVWMKSLIIDEARGIEFVAHTPESGKPTMDEGYKSVAATLVRINGLTEIYDVWLDNAVRATFNEFEEGSVDASAPVVTFTTRTKIEREGVPLIVPPAQ